MSSGEGAEGLYDVAVIGMAGRFPGAAGVEQLWDLLRRGVEAVRHFDAVELDRAGVPAELRERPGFVASRGVLADADLFDAPFFGFSPREARILDPQQRVFLEHAWEALEDAGCDPSRLAGAVGVYAGASQSTYFLRNLLSSPEVAATVSGLEVKLGNDKDFLAPLASYRLNLRGPSVNVATACSTASATWPWPAASRSPSRRSPATSTRRGASSRPTATAGPSTPAPPAAWAATAQGSWCSSAWRTPGATATGCAR